MLEILVVPCSFIAIFLIANKKDTIIHRRLGRIYMILMFFTATITLVMPAR